MTLIQQHFILLFNNKLHLMQIIINEKTKTNYTFSIEQLRYKNYFFH